MWPASVKYSEELALYYLHLKEYDVKLALLCLKYRQSELIQLENLQTEKKEEESKKWKRKRNLKGKRIAAIFLKEEL